MFSKSLTIFEGADGSGKTTAAKAYAEATGAHYVHLRSFLKVENVARLYVEAMMPAVLGHRDVVMDRSWLSELPYGRVFRGGADRLSTPIRRSLERLAARCATAVIYCRPPVDIMLANFRGRRGQEMLASDEQLRQVVEQYDHWRTALPFNRFDYTQVDGSHQIVDLINYASRTTAHRCRWASAGFLSAPVLLVGEEASDHSGADPLYQWPFGTLSASGCSHWLADRLEEAGVSERELTWLNADCSEDEAFRQLGGGNKLVVALGEVAATRLNNIGHRHFRRVVCVRHPQAHKRFHASEPYPLGETILKEKLP